MPGSDPFPSLPPGLAAIAAVRPDDLHDRNLASLAGVAGLLMALVDHDHESMMMHASGHLTWPEANVRTMVRVEWLAGALLGLAPEVKAVPGWNEPGRIDAHLVASLGVPHGPAEEVVRRTLLGLVLTGRDLMAEPDESAITETLRGAVLGMAIALTGGRPDSPTEDADSDPAARG